MNKLKILKYKTDTEWYKNPEIKIVKYYSRFFRGQNILYQRLSVRPIYDETPTSVQPESNTTQHLFLQAALPNHHRHTTLAVKAYHNSPHVNNSPQAHLNAIMNEYPQRISCYADGSKYQNRAACTYSVDAKIFSYRLRNSLSILSAELTAILLSPISLC